MKYWEKNLIEVMAKSDVDHLQVDVINYINNLLNTIVGEVENTNSNDIDTLKKDLRKKYIKN